MRIIPSLTIGGIDVSAFVEKIHCEQTANEETDPAKYDITLANVGGRFYSFFNVVDPESSKDGEVAQNPKSKVVFSIKRHTGGCLPTGSDSIKIFEGEVQYAQTDELYCNISGSCTEGGFSSNLPEKLIWMGQVPISRAVNDVLDKFGGIPASKRHIYPENDKNIELNLEFDVDYDFDRAIDDLAAEANSIYFFDEDDDFWFVPMLGLRGAVDVTGFMMRGSQAATTIGHCNFIMVWGGCPENFQPGAPGSEIMKQRMVYASAWDQDDIDERGLIVAPPLYYKNCNQKKCQEIADRTLEEYKQYADNPKVKLSGMAPPLLSKVSYFPYNAKAPRVNCGTEDEFAPITEAVVGVVIRRVVDLDAKNGFVCELELATNEQTLEEETA